MGRNRVGDGESEFTCGLWGGRGQACGECRAGTWREAAASPFADATLAQLKFNWRLAHDWQLVSPGQFEHGMRLMEEVGRLLGGWQRIVRAQTAARPAPAPATYPDAPPAR